MSTHVHKDVKLFVQSCLGQQNMAQYLDVQKIYYITFPLWPFDPEEKKLKSWSAKTTNYMPLRQTLAELTDNRKRR